MQNQLKILSLMMKTWVGNLSREFLISTRESTSKQALDAAAKETSLHCKALSRLTLKLTVELVEHRALKNLCQATQYQRDPTTLAVQEIPRHLALET